MRAFCPLIISGPPRSGTTLLYALFDNHPQVFWMISEGYFFEYLYDFGTSGPAMMCDAARRETGALIEGLREKELLPDVREGYRQEAGTTSKFFVQVQWNEAAFRDAMSKADLSSLGAFWHSLALAYCRGVGRGSSKYACMKAPDYAKSAASAAAHLLYSRSIVIARDPYYVANSLKRSRDMRGAKRLTWPGLAGLVASLNAMAERTKEAPASRVKVIRYEDLVRDAQGVMSKLASWLGIEMRASLLEPTVLGKAWPGHSSFAPTSGIEEAPAERPLTALDDYDREFIKKHARRYAEQFGYEL